MPGGGGLPLVVPPASLSDIVSASVGGVGMVSAGAGTLAGSVSSSEEVSGLPAAVPAPVSMLAAQRAPVASSPCWAATPA